MSEFTPYKIVKEDICIDDNGQQKCFSLYNVFYKTDLIGVEETKDQAFDVVERHALKLRRGKLLNDVVGHELNTKHIQLTAEQDAIRAHQSGCTSGDCE